MSNLGRCGAVVVCCFVALGLSGGVPASAETHSQLNPGGYVVAVSPSTVATGQTLQVAGDHFPAGADVSGQICGDNGLNGSVDCVLDNTGIAGVTSQGRFSMSIQVATPPTPCPCVVVITSLAMTTTPSAPITIIGARVAPVQAPPSAATVTRPLQIGNAQLEGNGPWYSWFGGMARRTLTLTVRNPNTGTYPHPSLVLLAGKQGTLSTVSTSPLPSIGPGKTTTVRLNVVFPAFSFGNNEVRGTVGDAALKEDIQVSTTVAPWGLIVIGLVFLQLILLAIRNSFRRRNARQSSTPSSSVTEELTPPDGVPAQPLEAESPQHVTVT